jgi:osmotically-inducible protein OsmY
MKNLKPLFALACALVLVGALSGCATDQSAAGKMTDEKITAAVQAMINQHPDVGPPDSVRVQTLDHVVYLSGQVSQGLMKQTAEDVARQTLGVTRVVNNVDVTH